MVGILALVVGVMLSSSGTALRTSRERILYEEAYQAAVSGTHIARGWLIDPDMARTQSGSSSIETDLTELVNKAKQMNEQIINDVKANKFTNLYGTSRFTAAGFSLGTQLSDGRYVLYTFPTNNGRVVNFINDPQRKKFDNNLFKGTLDSGFTNYVDMVRITTPGTNAETSSSLREATFIIEARGIAKYAGQTKTRIVQQRVLVYPNEPTAPLLSAGEAILTQGGMVVGGNSHANIHWAPVLTMGNIDMTFMKQIAKSGSAASTKWTLDTTSKNNDKFNGAGVPTDDPNFKYSGVMDKWLKWMAGSQGILTDVDGKPMFGNLPAGTKDFFAEALANNALLDPTYSKPMQGNIVLGGRYSDAGTTMYNPNGIYTTNDKGVVTGALVQGSTDVDKRVTDFFGKMNYSQLKEYAKTHNGYYYYDNGKFYNAAGVETALPDMVSQATPKGGFDPLGSSVNDRILFVDSKADKNSSAPNNPFSAKMPLPNFWKGVMYINGNVVSNGTGSSPDMIVRTPDQFKAFRETGSSGSYKVNGVLIDGILICQGIADLGGNTAIYGTLAAKGGVGVGGTPSIFYNSANGEGRLKDDDSQVAEYRIIAGRMYETASN